jgi:hypothetical protein
MRCKCLGRIGVMGYNIVGHLAQEAHGSDRRTAALCKQTDQEKARGSTALPRRLQHPTSPMGASTGFLVLGIATEITCTSMQPGGFYVYVIQREPAPGGPGSGLRRGRKRFLCQLQL